MKIDLLLVIMGIAIVIAISCFCFSIWNVFVTKKQTTLSLADFCLAMSVEVLIFITMDVIMIGVINIILFLWWIVIIIQAEKNLNRKNKEKE